MDYHKYYLNPIIYAAVNKAYYKLAKSCGVYGFSLTEWARESGYSVSTCKKYYDDTFADYSHDMYDKTIPSIEQIYADLEQECKDEGIDCKVETNYIYEIYHINRKAFPNKHYVGRTNDILRRMNKEHFNPNYWAKTPTKLLYWNMNQDGIENYAYRILDICSTEQEAKIKEEYWIRQLHTLATEGGFNERHEMS